MQKAVETILEEIALKHNLPKQVIEEIYNSQTRHTRDVIKNASKDYSEDKLPTIMWPKFGKIICNQKKYTKFKNIVNERRNAE